MLRRLIQVMGIPGELLLTQVSENLVGLARAGDTSAFDRLVSMHQREVYALAYRILGNAEDAADIQQETFVRAWRNLRRFRQDAAFSTWLHRIAVNLCLSAKRRKSLVQCDIPPEELASQSVGPNPGADVAALRRIIGSMPAHHRVLIVLRDLEGRSFEEIAGMIGCSVGSARSRLCKARGMLRERMRPYLEEE